MQQELEALLAVQADDLEIHGLEERLAALQPRLKELDQRKTRIANELERAQVLVTAEEKKQAHLREKITEHKALIDRNQTQMDAVKTMRQATAAVAQMEEARRIVATEESELVAINRRLEEARAALHAHQGALEACETEQSDARTEVASEQASLEGELAEARAMRTDKAKHVPVPLLGKYDKIRIRRRAQAAWAVKGTACGACDTAIPMQRRNQMSNHGGIDVCEACGVLMYFAE
ncbi:MAG: zinc ribbon domain-containing protein [Gemmatimonadaceae bacterium]